MKVGDLVKFNKTGVIALILEISDELNYKAVLLLPQSSIGTTMGTATDGTTWVTQSMLQRTARVISKI